MSFKILYNEVGNPIPNLVSMAVYIDAFAANLGIKHLNIDPAKLQSVASALASPDFPHADGLDKASPFKKAANFFVWFVAERPLLDDLPESVVPDDIREINNHQNVVFAYHIAAYCLHGAKIHKKDEEVTLSERIRVSTHFFRDFVEAFSAATPVTHFSVASLLFEQLCYKSNPHAPYQEVI